MFSSINTIINVHNSCKESNVLLPTDTIMAGVNNQERIDQMNRIREISRSLSMAYFEVREVPLKSLYRFSKPEDQRSINHQSPCNYSNLPTLSPQLPPKILPA